MKWISHFTLFSFYSQIIGPSTPLGGYSSGNNNNNNNNNDDMNNSNNYHDNYQNTNVNQKKHLNYITTKVFKSYIEDPSNEDNKFKRVRIRKLIKNLQNDGLDKNKFLLTIKNLTDSNQTIKFYVAKNLKENSYIYKDKKKIILNKQFFNQPHEVTFRSLSEIIKFVGNKYYPVRGKKVDNIIDKLKGEARSNFKLTLGNCIIHKVNQSILVVKEH